MPSTKRERMPGGRRALISGRRSRHHYTTMDGPAEGRLTLYNRKEAEAETRMSAIGPKQTSASSKRTCLLSGVKRT